MILIKAEVKGEPDLPPFARIFEYRNKSDEQIFFESLELIKQKLPKNLRINTNESLALYCWYIVDRLRARISIDSIEKNSRTILFTDKVMIGVPETLRIISFDVILDNSPKKKISIREPIPTARLSMGLDRKNNK
jgi:urease gamma subunit